MKDISGYEYGIVKSDCETIQSNGLTDLDFHDKYILIKRAKQI